MAKKINITAQLNAATVDGVVASAEQIKDEGRNKFQSEINTDLDGRLKQEANVRNSAVKAVQENLDAEIAEREVAYLGDLGDFVGIEAVGFVDSLLAGITKLGKGMGRYSFNIGGGGAGSKQFVTLAKVGSQTKLTIEGCLKAEVLNGDGLIDSVTSTVSTVVECDVTKKVWSYVNAVVDDTYYPEMLDEANVDEEAVQRSNKVMSKEQTLGVIGEVRKGVIYDVTANNNGATFDSLSALLSDENLSTLIPSAVRCDGMSIRFVQISDNKYVQYRCKTQSFSANPEDWYFEGDDTLVENPEWIWAITDRDLKFILGFRTVDGAPVFGYGCPPQVVKYVTEKLGTFNATDYASIKSFLGELISGDTLATLLNRKVDKVDGKSLIDSKVAENEEYIDNPEYLKSYTDKNGKLYEGITSDGKKVLFIPLFIGSALFESIDNPEYLKVLTDKKGRLAAGLKKDGTIYIPKLKSDITDEILASIKGKVTPPLVGKLMSTIGDSTTAMGRWQPTACEILGCTWDKSAISGGTLCKDYYNTVTAINLDSAIVTMQFGTNDWANTNLSLGNITDMADPEQAETPSYCGALNYSLKWLSDNLLYNNKNARVLLWTPLQRYDGIALNRLAVYGRNAKGEIINHEGKSLADFADAIIQIGAKWGFPVLDTHRICGFNEVSIGKWNENYIPSSSSRYEDWDDINPVDSKPNFVGNMLYDGLHPDYTPGGRILGTLIANKIVSLI